MIRIPLLITFLCLLTGAVMADEMNSTNNTTLMGDQNLTFTSNVTDALNLTATGSLNNLTNMTPGGNITGSEPGVAAKETPAKPVYKQSIGSVYNADYKEPEARTFSSSACGT